MTFLPIIQRELRVAARRKSTFRLRSWTAVLAMIISFFALMLLGLTGRGGSVGDRLFSTLTGYAFGLCLLAGVFLTADCLSSEKRDGTLGLLFLTDLFSYDIVLGKFAAMFLSAGYALLALLPIISLPLLLGGVTGGEFWRRALALANALFVSLAAGIWVSALAREGQRAMGRTLAVLLGLAMLPKFTAIPFGANGSRPFTSFGFVSPFYSFSYASATLYYSHAPTFWESLIASNVFGWLFLGMASYVLPRRWQERAVIEPKLSWSARRGERRPALNQKGTLDRRNLLRANPILWLVTRERGFGRLAWVVVLAWGIFGVGVTALGPHKLGGILGSSGARPFGFLLKLLFTFQVCRFFTEARRDGTLEMLLSTPLSSRDLIRGQSAAAWRTFGWPVLTFVVLLFVPVLGQLFWGASSFNLQQLLSGGLGLVASTVTAVRTITDFFALFWFGVWLALTMRKPGYAAGMTILTVLVLPSFLCWLDFFADLFFILLATTRLQQDFRWTLARRLELDPVISWNARARAEPP